MSWEAPLFWALAAAVVAVLVIWAHRCSRCGKWFAFHLQSRTQVGEGEVQVWKKQKGSDTARLVTEYRYSYKEVRVCTGCGFSVESSTSSKRHYPCGTFPRTAGEAKPAVGVREAPLQEGETFLQRWRRRAGWLLAKVFKVSIALLVVFLIGLTCFDAELLEYPGHVDEFLENFLEFLANPFSPSFREYRTTVEVAEGRWRKSLGILELRKETLEDWSDRVPREASIVSERSDTHLIAREGTNLKGFYAMEIATWTKFTIETWKQVGEIEASGTGAIPGTLTADIPVPGEQVLGSRRPGVLSEENLITFRDRKSGRMIEAEEFFFLRRRDRAYKLVGDFSGSRSIDGKTYSDLMIASGVWDARVREYSTGRIRIILYVDDFFR